MKKPHRCFASIICSLCSAGTKSHGAETFEAASLLAHTEAMELGMLKLPKVRNEHRVRHEGYLCAGCVKDVLRANERRSTPAMCSCSGIVPGIEGLARNTVMVYEIGDPPDRVLQLYADQTAHHVTGEKTTIGELAAAKYLGRFDTKEPFNMFTRTCLIHYENKAGDGRKCEACKRSAYARWGGAS